MCRHNWTYILPKSIETELDESQRFSFALDKFFAKMNDILYCDKCNHTGHYIKSRRGGVRRHIYETHYVQKANEIRAKYGLPLILTEITNL
jgi:hypothetical protein